MYVNIITLSTLWLILSGWGPVDSPSTLSMESGELFWEYRNTSQNQDWFPLTSSKQGPPYLGTDGPFVWTLTDPGEVVCDDEAVDSRPPKVDVQVFATTWFNMSEDRLWNLNTREQLLITSTDISTPKTQRREFPPSALLPEAGLLIDIWVFILSLLTQDHLWRSWSLEHALPMLWRKLKCPGERPTFCVTGSKRRRWRKKTKKGNREAKQNTSRNDIPDREICKGKDRKKNIPLLEKSDNITNGTEKTREEIGLKNLSVSTEDNLPTKQSNAKRRTRKKKDTEKSREPETANDTMGKTNAKKAISTERGKVDRGHGDSTGHNGDWTTVRRRKTSCRNSNGTPDKITDDLNKARGEARPESVTAYTVGNLSERQRSVKRRKITNRKKKVANRSHAPGTPNDSTKEITAEKAPSEKGNVERGTASNTGQKGDNFGPHGDNTGHKGENTGLERGDSGQEGDWTTVRRRQRKVGRRNSTGDDDMTAFAKSVSDRKSRRHTIPTRTPKPISQETRAQGKRLWVD